MMDSPDIASIVNMIMQNPKLIEEISAMARGSESSSDEKPEPKPDESERTEKIPTDAPAPTDGRRVHRIKLANAMKPYLSEGRRRAIDAMMSIADILEITRERS